jgi:predicted negative regulator of RcsB-dependent stress response
MAHYDLEEQEQIDTLKTWWKMYGNLVTGVVVAGSLAVIGWQGWNWYQRSQAAQASAIYGVLEQAVAARDAQKVKAAAGELAEKFGGTTYAALGALVAARQSFEAGDLKTARAQLTWAAENGKDEIRDLARLRLASVLLDEKAYDEALKQLEAAHAAAFAARFLELKGDVLAAAGKKPEARAAYQAALDKGEVREGRGGAGRELLRQKLDSLGEVA